MTFAQYIANLWVTSHYIKHISREEWALPTDPVTGLGGTYLHRLFIIPTGSPPGTMEVQNHRVVIVDYGLPTEEVFEVKKYPGE